MARYNLELADIVRAHQNDLVSSAGGNISGAQKRVLKAIATCRTAELGGHVQRCDHCNHIHIAYNSCRNRHCPKCQESAKKDWLSDRVSDLLPVEYFHVVFTIPHEIAAIALQNKKVIYEILFQVTAETLLQIATEPKHLGAQIGFLAVLHTWGQTLEFHPHIHCVIPGGGISPDGSRWTSCNPGIILPVQVLSRLFRGKFLHQLKQAFEQGRLEFHGNLSSLKERPNFNSYLKPLYKKDWFVYSKKPFGGPTQVLKYLAGYTHRVAISNNRLVSLENGKVTFTWKDYNSECKKRVMTLCATEFLRRFLLHILPKGFMRIRNYGFLSNRIRKKKIELCRRLIGVCDNAIPDVPVEPREDTDNALDKEKSTIKKKCPICKKGTMYCILFFKAGELCQELISAMLKDTS